MVILTSAGGILQLLYWVLAFRSKAPIFSPALFRIRNFAIGIAGNIVCRLGGSCLGAELGTAKSGLRLSES